MGWLADRYRRPPIIGWANLAFAGFLASCGCGHQRVPAVLGAARRRRREVEHLPGARFDDRRRLPDQRARAHQRLAGDGRRASSACSARSSSPASRRSPVATTAGGGRSCCSASRSRSWRSSRSSCRNRRAASSRSRTCSARSSRTSSRRRSRSKPRSPGSGRSARSRPSSSRSRRMGFGLFTVAGAHQPLHGGRVRHRHLRPGRARHHRRHRRAARAALRRAVLRPASTAAIPRERLRFVGLMILPAALLTPVQYFMPNVIAVHDRGHPAADPAVGRRSRWCEPVLQSVVPVPAAGHGLGARVDLHLLHRRDRRRAPLRAAHRRVRLAYRGDRDRRPVDDRRRVPDPPRARRSSATTCRWSSPSSRRRWTSTGASSSTPTEIPALQVADIDFAYGPVQVLFDVGFEVRKGEVLALLGTNGAGKSTILRAIAGLGHAATRRRAAQRPHHHLHDARAAGAARYPHPARRQGRVPGDDGAREPGDGGVRVPRRRRRLPASARPRVRAVPRARRTTTHGRVAAVGWSAADAGAGDDAAPRPRGARHRRALARPRAARRAGAARA